MSIIGHQNLQLMCNYPYVCIFTLSLSIDTIKKAWSPTIADPLPEALALPIVLDRQREAHAEYKYTLVPHT